MPSDMPARPEVGDTLIVIHNFQARTSDELSLVKGDKVALIERDDEFGDGWFFGRHLASDNTGLFPEVYTRPVPKPTLAATNGGFAPLKPLSLVPEPHREVEKPQSEPAVISGKPDGVASASRLAPMKTESLQTTLPLLAGKADGTSNKSDPTATSSLYSLNFLGRLNTNQDSHVLSDTLNVIDEHITDLRSPQSVGLQRTPATDSGSEYSAHLDRRISYIAGEETDEEEESRAHTRAEVLTWSSDDVAEYLFTAGVEKKHCEIFRDQEITGEVLLGMDQSSVFIRELDLGSVGRRLRSWQKIKSLQDEVNGSGGATRRTTQTYGGSDAGGDDGRKTRSRTSTITSGHRQPVIDTRRSSQTPRVEPTIVASPVSPGSLQDSPSSRGGHARRPSAASIRELHHSRRHSSTDFRLANTPMTGGGLAPKMAASPQALSATSSSPFVPSTAANATHQKQPSFDRNWTMGNAYAHQRPLSSTGLHDILAESEGDLQDSAVDLDRGYFSGTELDGRKRNVLRKRESGSHKSSYAEEQRVRSATTISRQSRYGSFDSSGREGVMSAAAQKHHGGLSDGKRRSVSGNTSETLGLTKALNDKPPPTVARLDAQSSPQLPTPASNGKQGGGQADWMATLTKPAAKMGGSLRALSESVSGGLPKIGTAPEFSPKDSPMQSPARTGSSTPSGGPSFDLESPLTTKSSIVSNSTSKASRKKSKKETSAYTRGLQAVTPHQAIIDADYSGWMRKKSSNLMTTWKPRFFILKGRRLSYYYSEDDDAEKGLIDISFHRVLPADNERLTGLHATITGAGAAAAVPNSTLVSGYGSNGDGDGDGGGGGPSDDSVFIFKLMPPRAGLSRAVNFTKPTVHYFAVPNVKQGRLWMAALMKATIDRDDSQPMTTTYQQKTISLNKARAQRHRPPALMTDEAEGGDARGGAVAAGSANGQNDGNVLNFSFGETDSGVAGLASAVGESSQQRFLGVETDREGTGPKTA